MKITEITYEEDRLTFFSKQMKLAEKRYKQTVKKVKQSDSYLSETNLLASEAGQELCFYKDVVEMLAKDLSTRKQVKDLIYDSKGE
jgi:hypothetical protein